MSPTEMGWLSVHMGHDLRTHNRYYRQQEALIELSKISRLLLATDSGSLAKFRGKALSEISLNGESCLSDAMITISLSIWYE